MAKPRFRGPARTRDQKFLESRASPPTLPFFLLRQDYEPGETTGFHKHLDFYALYIVQAGRGLHIIDGHPYAVARGDVYMTAPGATHAYQQFNGLKADALCFQFELFSLAQQQALRALPGFARLFIGGAESEENRREHFHLSPHSLAHAEEHIRELRAEFPPGIESWPRDDAVSTALIPALVFRLLVWLARERASSLRRTVDDPAAAESLATILRYCETHYTEELTVPALAARLFVTPNHFGEIFRRATGTTPAAYVRRLRLERAQELLRTTEWPLERIAAESGLGNGAQMSRAFRTAFDQTPTQYRTIFRAAGRRPL